MDTLLKKLVSINSQFPNEMKIGEFLEAELKKIGFKTKRVYISKDRFNILGERGVLKKGILYYGHLDTIPLVNREKWKTNPYKLTKVGDRLYGLGSYDMKGGISAFMKAFELSNSPAKVLLAVDEENISEGSWKVVKNNKAFFTGVELIISAEPDFGNGVNSLTNERTGRVVFKVTFKGKSAHIAQYKKGIDAIEMASKFLTKFYENRETIFRKSESVAQVRKVYSESVGMSVPASAVVEVEVLLSHKTNIKNILLELSKLTDAEISLKKRKTPYLEGYFFPNFSYKKVIQVIVKKHCGVEMKLIGRKSVGDDNVLATLGVPVLTWGPSGDNAHTENEYVSQKSLGILTKMFIDLLENTK